MTLRTIHYEWEDGKTLTLTLTQWEALWDILCGEATDENTAYLRLIRALAEGSADAC